MGTTLTGTTPQDTYDSLIKVTDNGPISGTAKFLSDGLGNDSVLALSNARVGVGTASPATTLDVAGTLRVSSATPTEEFFNTSNGDVWASIFSQASGTGSGASLVFSTKRDGNSATDKMTITQAGNVGIGTSAPLSKFDVATSATEALCIANASTAISAGDLLGAISFGSRDGSANSKGGITNIRSYATTTYNNDFVSADMRFYTASALQNTTGAALFGTEVARFLAGGGLTFNGDTAAANALDDYEEGTWSPVITDGTNDATMIGGFGGTYTKIGQQVTVNAYCRTTALGSVSGDVFIKGLPFTSSGVLQSISSATFGYYTAMALGTAGYSVGGFVNTSATQITLTLNDSTGGITTMQASEWSNSGYVHLTITYFV